MSNTRKALVALAAGVLGATLMTPVAKAGQSDQLTRFTFDQPVEVPGTVLSPGSYWFKTVGQENDAMKNMINIYDSDFSLVATVPAVPIQRKNEGYGTSVPESSMDHTVVRIADGTGGNPSALLTWYYPSGYTGHEFMYKHREKSSLEEEPSRVITSDGYVATSTRSGD